MAHSSPRLSRCGRDSGANCLAGPGKAVISRVRLSRIRAPLIIDAAVAEAAQTLDCRFPECAADLPPSKGIHSTPREVAGIAAVAVELLVAPGEEGVSVDQLR